MHIFKAMKTANLIQRISLQLKVVFITVEVVYVSEVSK
jgi:hypothetical protein